MSSSINWVGENDIGIPARGLFVIVFSVAGYSLICVILHVALLHVNAGKGPPAPTTADSLQGKLLKTPQFWYRGLFLVMASFIGGFYISDTCSEGTNCWNWHLIFWYSLLFVVTANFSNTPHEFYLGEGVSLKDVLNFYLRNKPLPTPEEINQRVADKYFKEDDGHAVEGIGFWTLMPSVFITWIFAKSIRNSAVLGARFGMLGGLAYNSWYLSFFSSGIVCYVLRTRYGFKSLPTAVFKNYGAVAVLCFQLCVLFRLFNEVWSNAAVIGQFYGTTGSESYWGATWFSVLVPATYVVMGGMRVSLFSDVLQAALAVLFMVVILSSIASDDGFSDAFSYSPSEALWGVDGWQPGWWAYTIAGSIGGMISYPWFDPVLTDRAFLGKPKVMLASFLIGGLCAMAFIFFYAVIGVYGAWLKEHYGEVCDCTSGFSGVASTSSCPSYNGDWNPCEKLVGTVGEASDVAWILGHRTYRGVEIFVNLVMITASLSTLDSTFTSASKLVSLEFAGWLHLNGDRRDHVGPLRPVDIGHIGEKHITVARAAIMLLMFVGNSFLGYEKDAMSATTVAGMAVMGIGLPIWWMTIWRQKSEKRGCKGWRKAPLAFIVPFGVGYFIAISYYIQGERVKDYEGDDVDSVKGWTYDLNVGTYTKADGSEAQNAYGRYLGTMLLGHGICITSFFVFWALHQVLPWTEEVEEEQEASTEFGISLPGKGGNAEGESKSSEPLGSAAEAQAM